MTVAKPLILYDNRFADATPTATDTGDGYDVENLTDLRMYTFWKAASAGTKYITVDCGVAASADTLGIIGHNLKTAGATVSVEYSSDNFAADINEALAGFQPSDDTALLKKFTTQSARYWRLKIVTASIAPKIAVLCAGVRLDFERTMKASGFDPFPEKIIAESSKSKEGHLLGSVIRYVETEIKPQWKALTTTWLENSFRPAWDDHLSQLKPFFWAWDIGDHPSEIYFVRIPDNFLLRMPMIPGNPAYRSLSLTLRGVKE